MKALVNCLSNFKKELLTCVRRSLVWWSVRIPKRFDRVFRLYGAICRINVIGNTHKKMTEIELKKWYKNAGRILNLEKKWFNSTRK